MKHYSFENGILLINGLRITGWGDGSDAFTAERTQDSADDVTGADGEMSVNLKATRRGQVKIKLLQTSDSNKYLSGLINAQENAAFVPIFAQYTNTVTLDTVSGTQGYIKAHTPIIHGDGINETEWTFIVERLDLFALGAQ